MVVARVLVPLDETLEDANVAGKMKDETDNGTSSRNYGDIDSG